MILSRSLGSLIYFVFSFLDRNLYCRCSRPENLNELVVAENYYCFFIYTLILLVFEVQYLGAKKSKPWIDVIYTETASISNFTETELISSQLIGIFFLYIFRFIHTSQVIWTCLQEKRVLYILREAMIREECVVWKSRQISAVEDCNK